MSHFGKPQFIIATIQSSMEGLPLAMRLKQEGYDTVLAIMDEKLADPKSKPPISKDGKLAAKLSTKVGDNLVKKMPIDKIIPNVHTLFIWDFNYGYTYAQKLRHYKGIMGYKWAYEFERNRKLSAQFVRSYYPHLNLPEEKDFSNNSTDKVLKFIESSKDFWVIKPASEELFIFVPGARDDHNHYLQSIQHYLQENKAPLDKTSIQLQRRVTGYEACVETWYRNGTPILCNIDLENKNKYAGDLPPQTGCVGDLVFTIDLNSPLRLISNQPFDRFAKRMNFTGLMDANIILEETTGRPYFLEFCPARFGYNCLYAFLDKIPNVGDFFSWVILGVPQQSIPPLFGASLRIFDDNHNSNLLSLLDKSLKFRSLTADSLEHIWLWDVLLDGKDLQLVGANQNTAVVTASHQKPEIALQLAKKRANTIKFDTPYWRYDIDGREGRYSILNRYDYLDKLL